MFKRFITVLLCCTLAFVTPTYAEPLTVQSSAVPNMRVTPSVTVGDNKVKLKYKRITDGKVKFTAPADGRYVFVFSDVESDNKALPAIFCFYDENMFPWNVDGLSVKSNGFALGYNSATSKRTSYKDKMGVSLVLDSGTTVYICASNLLLAKKGSVASYSLTIHTNTES